MRLNGQFGRVFQSGLDKTPAHELGHGIFKLEHPFEQYKTSESSTDFLMDYSSGTVLNHQDWKQINDPVFKLYAFQKQESGELNNRIFKDANGKYFNSSNNISVGVCLGESDVQKANQLPNGSVYTIYTLDNKNIYFAVKEGNQYVYRQRDNGAYVGESYQLDYISTLLTDEQKKKAFEIFYPAINQQKAINISTGKEDNGILRGCENENANIAYQIITQDKEQTLKEFYEELKDTYDKVIAFYQNCSNQQWKPGKEPGIVPKCFWENTTTEPDNYYDINDIAFMSGVIDGGYAEIDGIAKAIKLLLSGKIQEKLNDLGYAYTLAYLECQDKDIKLDKKEYKELIDKLSKAHQDTGIWNWVKEKYYEPKAEDLGKEIQKCEDASQLRADISNALIEIKEAIDSWEEIKTLVKNIKDKIVGYYNLVTSKENVGRYEAGRLVIPVASTIVPIIGQIGKAAKISKVKTILKGIKELSESKTDDLVEKLVAKGEDVGIVAKTRFIARTGGELKIYLDNLKDLPKGMSYEGDLYRSLSIKSETVNGALPNQMTDHHIYSSWGRYDLQGEDNAMYLSKALNGNKTELVPHYGNWEDFSTYKYENIKADNLLDLTDESVRLKLGIEFDQITKISTDRAQMYEYTNILASWARENYNGIIAPGARGTKNYQNVILFNQDYIDNLLVGNPARILDKISGKWGVTLDATKLGKDNATILASKWITPESGWYDVVIHGTPDNFMIYTGDKWVSITHRDLVNYLISKGYKKGTPIRLISCNTGIFPDTIAKNLANKIGANVKAPKGYITVFEAGSYKISNSGTWQIFDIGIK